MDDLDWADELALEILQPVDITADVANALRLQYTRGRLDVVRRLREMADAEKAEADARGEAGATRASLLNRAAGMRFAADQLEAEIRGKAGG